MLEALAVNHFYEFFMGQRFATDGVFVDLAFLDQHCGAAFEHARKFWRTVQSFHYQPVDGEQPECADDATGDGVVITDDGVLHRVRERQQHHEVEGIELRQLALAKHAQEDYQNEIDNNWPKQLLKDGKGQMKHVAEEIVGHGHEDSRSRLFLQADHEIDVVGLRVGSDVELGLYTGQRFPQDRIFKLRFENKRGDVGLVERIAGHELPVMHEELAQIVAGVVKPDQGQAIDRAGIDVERVVDDAGGFIDFGVGGQNAIEVAF